VPRDPLEWAIFALLAVHLSPDNAIGIPSGIAGWISEAFLDLLALLVVPWSLTL
jgi:hypothetical protein